MSSLCSCSTIYSRTYFKGLQRSPACPAPYESLFDEQLFYSLPKIDPAKGVWFWQPKIDPPLFDYKKRKLFLCSPPGNVHSFTLPLFINLMLPKILVSPFSVDKQGLSIFLAASVSTFFASVFVRVTCTYPVPGGCTERFAPDLRGIWEVKNSIANPILPLWKITFHLSWAFQKTFPWILPGLLGLHLSPKITLLSQCFSLPLSFPQVPRQFGEFHLPSPAWVLPLIEAYPKIFKQGTMCYDI